MRRLVVVLIVMGLALWGLVDILDTLSGATF